MVCSVCRVVCRDVARRWRPTDAFLLIHAQPEGEGDAGTAETSSHRGLLVQQHICEDLHGSATEHTRGKTVSLLLMTVVTADDSDDD